MPNFQITDLAPETSLTEAETSSIIGGFGFSNRGRKRSGGKQPRRSSLSFFQDNFQFQSNVGIAQGNSAMGTDDKQDNYSDVNIFFL